MKSIAGVHHTGSAVAYLACPAAHVIGRIVKLGPTDAPTIEYPGCEPGGDPWPSPDLLILECPDCGADYGARGLRDAFTAFAVTEPVEWAVYKLHGISSLHDILALQPHTDDCVGTVMGDFCRPGEAAWSQPPEWEINWLRNELGDSAPWCWIRYFAERSAVIA